MPLKLEHIHVQNTVEFSCILLKKVPLYFPLVCKY
uniref:Uncharacterized protein n=1 Tax=Anguilla anguilla TaxID=7936 RepID=A0A0E9S112_ANGAN